MKSGKSKSKGNAFENSIAKKISLWITEDKDKYLLGRDLTSGAIKTVWVGDIIPNKQLLTEFKGKYPFLIECKHGYGQHTPTFIAFPIIEKWLIKCLKETELTHTQKTILLITKFKYKKTILITNYLIDTNLKLFKLAIPIKQNGQIIYFYLYMFEELFKYNFFQIFSNLFKEQK